MSGALAGLIAANNALKLANTERKRAREQEIERVRFSDQGRLATDRDAKPNPGPYYAKSGGLWLRDPVTHHGTLMMSEVVNGEAGRVASILNYYAAGRYAEGRKPESTT